MPPYLVTAPTAQPVTLAEVKAHLRVISTDEDTDISARLAGAIAHLDGWGGALGRCIMSQVWALDVEGPGPHVLPFPEASNVAATGVSGVVPNTVARTPSGPAVTVADADTDAALVLQFTSAMPATRLPMVKQLIKLMVQREYDPLTGPEATALDNAIAAMTNNLRWRPT